MRSYRSTDVYFSKIKKKPAVQHVINHINDYTDDEILALTGNQFPKWIREELVKYKNRNGQTSEQRAHDIAAMMPTHNITEQYYPAYRYTGNNTYVTSGKDTFQTPLENNELILVLTKDDKGCTIKLGYDVCKISFLKYASIILESDFIGEKTINEYNSNVSEYLNNKY